MSQRLLFLTPPFTQLNTPYPATAYLKGYLNTLEVPSWQADLGLEVILKLFTREGLAKIYEHAGLPDESWSDEAMRLYRLRDIYLSTIEEVIRFLQDKNPTLAYYIAERDYLPEGARFDQLDDLEWAFGTMGVRDKARYLATLYLEDIGDFITEVVDPHFGFSRYAERLSMSATDFDDMAVALAQPEGLIENITIDCLDHYIATHSPTSVGLSVPFPGNLYAALRCGQYIKAKYPGISVWMGGGYVNTELRAITDPRLFDFIDFLLLDDGEAPIRHLIEHLDGNRTIENLKRAFLRKNGTVIYCNESRERDVAQRETGTPDYSGLPLSDYLSVIEVANPMHRLWSDGRWNKLTMAHGCYWGKCTFCDISLDYIQRYEPLTAAILCDRMEEIIKQTGQSGFHFVDEAAPPALMRELAIEILRRQMTVVWWTNIRFEQSFTADLCRLLRASGCIAVSGGLEVASDRLLAMIKKGVTVGQVARVTNHFSEAGIMVHAYLMYGFPTQTAQETVDSLEMVRQLFMQGTIQSAYWHRFAMTAHSPVGISPQAFGVLQTGPQQGGFAHNDLAHEDPQGADHGLYGDGLRKSLFNYMHGVGFDEPLQYWFDHRVPTTSIPPRYIEKEIYQQAELTTYKDHHRVVWLGHDLILLQTTSSEQAVISFINKKDEIEIALEPAYASWLVEVLASSEAHPITIKALKSSFPAPKDNFEAFTRSDAWQALCENGLLIV